MAGQGGYAGRDMGRGEGAVTTRAEKLKRFRAELAELERRALPVKPDPRYSTDGPSQYPEGIVMLSAGPSFDAEVDKLYRSIFG